VGHTFAHHLYHIVFSTKGRERWITPEIQEEVCKYISGIARNSGAAALAVNAMADHIHLLIKVKPFVSISDLVRTIKANSSKWLSGKKVSFRRFAWQAGYSSFTVSESHRAQVAAYIENQQDHHRRKGFAEELAAFLQRHGVPFDPENYLD